jgi:hypothetical protein
MAIASIKRLSAGRWLCDTDQVATPAARSRVPVGRLYGMEGRPYIGTRPSRKSVINVSGARIMFITIGVAS